MTCIKNKNEKCHIIPFLQNHFLNDLCAMKSIEDLLQLIVVLQIITDKNLKFKIRIQA